MQITVPDGNSGKAKSLQGTCFITKLTKHSKLNYNPEIKENIDDSLSTRKDKGFAKLCLKFFRDHDNP